MRVVAGSGVGGWGVAVRQFFRENDAGEWCGDGECEAGSIGIS